MLESPRTGVDYLRMLVRQKTIFIGVSAFLLLLATIAIHFIPPLYKATGTVLIEQHGIPEELVPSTITSYADERLQIISQRVLTTENLKRIIFENNALFVPDNGSPKAADILTLRENISIDMVNVDVVNPRTGNSGEATIAFEVSYRDRSPLTAQEVTKELVNLYLKESAESRTRRASETASFLTHQGERIARQISRLEDRIARFKEKNAEVLPELKEFYLRQLERLDSQLTTVHEQARSLRDQKGEMESELAMVRPHANLYAADGSRLLSAGDQLKILETEYVTAATRYSRNHPDLIELKDKIAALQHYVGSSDTSELESRLKVLSVELASKKTRYSQDHPDVKGLQREIARLKGELSTARLAARRPLSTSRPDNPDYLRLQARVSSMLSDLQLLEASEANLTKKIDHFEKLIAKIPQTEEGLQKLVREHENAVERYREIKAKETEAQLAQAVEDGQQGERLTLIEPPVLPVEPDSPNRPVLLGLSLLLAVAAGLIAVVVREQSDDTIYDGRDLAAVVQEPALAVIPYV